MNDNPELTGPLPEINTDLANAVGPEALIQISPSVEVAQKVDNLIPIDAIQEVANIKTNPVVVPPPATPPINDLPTLADAGGGDQLAALGNRLQTQESLSPSRPNTAGERAVAGGTTNKSPEQITADQRWLASEDPANPGFRVDGKPLEDPEVHQGTTVVKTDGIITQPPVAEGTTDPEVMSRRIEKEARPDVLAVDAVDKPNLSRRDELSKKVLDGTATEDDKAEFGKLVDSPFNNGEIVAPSPEGDATEYLDVNEMGATEIAEEQNRLIENTDRTPKEDARLQELEAAWDGKLDAAGSMAQEVTEPTGEPTPDHFKSKLEQDRAIKQVAIDKFRNGEDLTDDDQRVLGADMAQMEEIQDALDSEDFEKLDAYQKDIVEKYGMSAKEKPVGNNTERENKIRDLQAEIQRNGGTPEKRRELDQLKAEGIQEEKDLKDRNILRDRLLNPKGEPLSDEEHTKLDELNKKLEGREPTPEEKSKEIDRLATKMAEDMMNGRDIDEADLEQFRTLKAEQALKAAGVESGKEAIMKQIKDSLANKRLSEKQETKVENQTKEKLAVLMNLEMQMLAIPRQLEALARAQRKLKRDIDAKKGEVGTFSNQQEAQKKRRTELYPLMMGLAQNKGLIGHYKNHSMVLRAEYKTAMADLNRTLRLNGRFGIVQDVFQHVDAMISRAYVDIKTDYDSVYASEASDAEGAAKKAA